MLRRLLLPTLLSLLLLPVSAVHAATTHTDYISEDARHTVIQIITLCGLLIGAFLLFWANRQRNQHERLWFVSAIFTILCVVAIGIIWYTVVNRSPDEDRANEILLLDQATVDSLITERVARSSTPPIIVPTGAFIQSIEFDNSNNVKITGYIWQRYPKDVPADFEYGFVMPEGYEVTAEDAYRFETEDALILGWYVNTTLRQAFDYRLFPFDRQAIWLRLWAKDFRYSSMLVPDLASYEENWNPGMLPGLENDFVLEHWQLDRTFFTMRSNTYSASFGIPGYEVNTPAQELYFNIEVKRDIVDAFIGHMIPLLIVLLMAFGVQFIITQIPDKMSLHGINTIGVMGYCASLFFIAILAQLNLRSQLNASTVIYFEYFYFVVYIVLLLITINAIVFVASDHVPFLEFEDNLYPKLLFGPITGVLFLAVTLVEFYR